MSKRNHALQANNRVSVSTTESPDEYFEATILQSKGQDQFCINQPRNGSMSMAVHKGQILFVHCTHGDHQFAFETEIQSVQSKPNLRINLAAPQRLSAIMRRQGLRTPLVRTIQPALRLKLHDGRKILDVHLKDLDQFGACLNASEPLGEVNEKFTIETYDRRFDRPVSLRCVIRYLRRPGKDPSDNSVSHGVSFEGLGNAAELFIEHLTAPHIRVAMN